MKVFVINRDSAVERRRFQEEQLKKLGLNYEFVTAIEGSALSDNLCQAYADTWPSDTFKQDIGCFLSHREVWKRIYNEQSVAVVLEDDVLLSRQLSTFVMDLKSTKTQWNEVFDLEYTPELHTLSKTRIHDFTNSNRRSIKIYKNRIGLAAYVLNHVVASKMLNETKSYKLIDSFFWHCHWMNAQQIEPALAIQFRFISDTKTEVFSRNPSDISFKPSSYFKKTWQRARLEANRSFWIIRSMFTSEKRHIKVNFSEFTN